MARLSYPDSTQISSATQQVLEQVPAQLHLFRMLAYAQSALAPTLLLGKAILAEQELAAELRELAILQVAKQAKADYEWVQHVPIARAAGVTDEQIALVEQGRQEAPAFDPRARLVLRVAREVVAGPYLSEEVFAALQTHFSPREMVELLLTIGYYLMLGRIMTTLQIDLDPPSGNAVVEAAKQEALQAQKATQAVSAKASKEAETMLETSFQALQRRFQPAEAAGINVTIQVMIEGAHRGIGSLRIVDGTYEFIKGGVPQPDSTITLPEADWLAFVDGTLDPMNAFMAGRLKVTGNMQLASRLQSLFSR